MDKHLSYKWDARKQKYGITWNDRRLPNDIIFYSERLPEGYEALADIFTDALSEVLKHRGMCFGAPYPQRNFGTISE